MRLLPITKNNGMNKYEDIYVIPISLQRYSDSQKKLFPVKKQSFVC
jgi:hypothetical protein